MYSWLGHVLCFLGLHSWKNKGIARYGRGWIHACARCPAVMRTPISDEELDEELRAQVERVRAKQQAKAYADENHPPKKPARDEDETETLKIIFDNDEPSEIIFEPWES